MSQVPNNDAAAAPAANGQDSGPMFQMTPVSETRHSSPSIFTHYLGQLTRTHFRTLSAVPMPSPTSTSMTSLSTVTLTFQELPTLEQPQPPRHPFQHSQANALPRMRTSTVQKLERRERNREHAKRSRLRKKFLLESLQEQIHGLQEQLEKMKEAFKRELPHRSDQIINDICGNKEKYTPLPMPSGFGPVKTLMEPDFRLMSALSGSQQNFAISDPTLPDNPIVYVSQGFLDLTGYTLDQVLGRNCRFLQGPGTDQSAVDVIRKGIQEGIDTSVCLLNYKADGTPFWNQFFVAALRDAENNVVNYVGVQCEVSKAVVEKHMGDGK